MNFEQFNFDPRIMQGIEAAGYQTPTPIQQQAIPEVLSGRDVLGLAQTGTGKTAAFMLPVLERLTQGKLRKIRVLIVAPTRELAQQIHDSSQELSKYTKIRSMTMYGGVGKGKQRNELQRGVEIIVACPGRFLDMVKEERINLSNIEVLILDEADQMCDMGFLPDIKRICNLLPRQRQTLFFSATMPKEIRKLTQNILTDPVTVQIGMIAPAETVTQAVYHLPDGIKAKREQLAHILETEATAQVLVFTRTKRRAKVVAQQFEKRGYRAGALQGNMSQNARQRAMDNFRKGKLQILVATDIAARGIDVSNVSHVINFDMPDTIDAYTHRIGRTGRAQQEGLAYSFTTSDDKGMIRQIERVLKKSIKVIDIPEEVLAKIDLPEDPSEKKENSQKRSSSSSNRGGGGRSRSSRNNRNRRSGGGGNGGGRSNNSSSANRRRRSSSQRNNSSSTS